MTKQSKPERRVEVILEDWAEFLGLSQQWEITFSVVDGLRGQSKQGADEADTIADVIFAYPYLKAHLRIDKGHAVGCSNRDLESLILHELVHILLERIYGPIKEYFGANSAITNNLSSHFETAVDSLTRILLRSRSITGKKRSGVSN